MMSLLLLLVLAASLVTPMALASGGSGSGDGSIQWPLFWMYQAISIGGGLGMYYGIGGIFELIYYRGKRNSPETWKCQPKRWPSAQNRKSEIILGSINMTLGSMASGIFVYYLATGGQSSIYFDLSEHGLIFSILSGIAYFLLTDLGLYWAHRIFHRPNLFKYIHRWHHRYTSPTAFTAAAMHPVEFFTYQSVMLIPLFFMPVHVIGVVCVLIYQNYVALVDHSGIKLYSWWPWQPATQFHDDHHVYFHVNYGQNLGVWDWMFGTWRRHGRRYGVEVFGGKGEALAAGSPEPVRYVDYSRKGAEQAQREAQAIREAQLLSTSQLRETLAPRDTTKPATGISGG